VERLLKLGAMELFAEGLDDSSARFAASGIEDLLREHSVVVRAASSEGPSSAFAAPAFKPSARPAGKLLHTKRETER